MSMENIHTEHSENIRLQREETKRAKIVAIAQVTSAFMEN